MDQIAYNIGYIGRGNSGILSYYPSIWDCDFKTFAKKIRQKGNTKALFKWAKEHHVTPSSVALFVVKLCLNLNEIDVSAQQVMDL